MFKIFILKTISHHQTFFVIFFLTLFYGGRHAGVAEVNSEEKGRIKEYWESEGGVAMPAYKVFTTSSNGEAVAVNPWPLPLSLAPIPGPCQDQDRRHLLYLPLDYPFLSLLKFSYNPFPHFISLPFCILK